MYEKALRCKQGGANIPMISFLKTVESAHYMSTTLVTIGTIISRFLLDFKILLEKQNILNEILSFFYKSKTLYKHQFRMSWKTPYFLER